MSRDLPFTVQIPVFNETSALIFSIYYFHQLGICARYVLDAQSSSETRGIIGALGHDLVYFQNDKPFIENGYESFASASPTDWILRMDCDEVPSLELIEFSREFVSSGQSGIVGFARHQILFRGNELLTATTDRFLPANQRQWRLFNRTDVTFDRQIHTPGLLVKMPVVAPDAAEFFHLSWVFLDWEARLKKAARYDDYGQPAGNRRNQLFPLEEVTWRELDAPFLRDTYQAWIAASATGPQARQPARGPAG